jgi:putative sugar O-methyltransferase
MPEASLRQLDDDRELLELMLVDQTRAPAEYQPTNYWAKYINETIRVLRQDGLRDFRRQPQGYFRSFGACDANTTTALQKLYLERSTLSPEHQHVALSGLEFVHANPRLPVLPYNLCLLDLDETAARVADIEGRLKGAAPLTSFTQDLVGNPWHSLEYRGKRFTHLFLSYYMRYSYLCQFLDLGKVDSVVELGSGAGNQIEILKKAYPQLTFYLLDLSPYLYVCHQFLKSVFPSDVVDYRRTRDLREITAPKPGSIIFLGSWQLSAVQPKGTTLFWNSASFGEMEPEVVQNYISQVKPWAHAVYLYQCMIGKEVGTKGKGGVLQQTRFEHYCDFLGAEFQLVDRSPAYVPLRFQAFSGGYDDACWVRKGVPAGGLLKVR